MIFHIRGGGGGGGNKTKQTCSSKLTTQSTSGQVKFQNGERRDFILFYLNKDKKSLTDDRLVLS